jgi:hypothetical protein
MPERTPAGRRSCSRAARRCDEDRLRKQAQSRYSGKLRKHLNIGHEKARSLMAAL